MVQRVNIEKLLEEHLPEEIDLINEKISSLQESLSSLMERRDKLIRIGVAAGVNLPINTRNGAEGFDRNESDLPRSSDSVNLTFSVA